MKHYNTRYSRNALEQFRTKTGDHLGDEVSGPVATIELMPDVKIQGATSSGTSTTVYSIPANQRFYLCGFTFSLGKGGTSAATSATLQATQDGRTVQLAVFRTVTTLSERREIFLTFPHPVRLDSGTNVTIEISSTTDLTLHASLYFYQEEL